ncbi:MAG: rhomboid family intramembrane serine protease [Kineosporiaceae bacterium]
MTSPVPGGASPDAPPVCPRHPDRVSYVRCQRCERPVCPQCQRPAAVGVQCVDCVKEGAKTVRRARTVFGATISPDQRPVLTMSVIGLCVVLWVAQITGDDSFTDRLLFAPVVSRSEPWRFLTSAFLHSTGSPLHLAFNMYALWLTGPVLEAVFGRVRFAALYLLAALGGSVAMLVAALPSASEAAWVAGEAAWWGGSLGASGAVFGLFAATLVVNRRLGADNGALIAVIAINAVLGFTLPNVAWEAHLGGFVVGGLAAIVLVRAASPSPRGSVGVRQALGLGLLAAAMVVTVVVCWSVAGPEVLALG